MNPATVKIAAVSIIAVFAGIFAFKSSRSLREAKNLTKSLELQVDSLRMISSQYDLLLSKYDSLYERLDATRTKLTDVQAKISRLNTQHLNGLSEIQNELGLLIEHYDHTVVWIRPEENADLDTLKL